LGSEVKKKKKKRKETRNLEFSSLSAHGSAAQTMERTATSKEQKYDVKKTCKKRTIFNLWEIEPH
jgi:hypothetical protein